MSAGREVFWRDEFFFFFESRNALLPPGDTADVPRLEQLDLRSELVHFLEGLLFDPRFCDYLLSGLGQFFLSVAIDRLDHFRAFFGFSLHLFQFPVFLRNLPQHFVKVYILEYVYLFRLVLHLRDPIDRRLLVVQEFGALLPLVGRFVF